MEQGFLHAEIGVVQLDIFAHQRNGHFFSGVFDSIYHGGPMGHVRRRTVKSQLAAYDRVQPLPLQQQRHLIQRGCRGVLDHALLRHVAEQGDLFPHVRRNGHIAAAHQDIRLDPQSQQLLDRMLGGFAFQLAAARHLHDQGHMDVHHIFPAFLHRHLSDGLQKRLAFNVTHRAANLTDQHVQTFLLHGIDVAFDLIRHMRNDLHRAAQKCALPLPVEKIPVHPAGGHGAPSRQALVHKPLIVAKIQIGLRPVVGDKHLAVLIGTHGAGIHIQIGVEFLVPHLQPPLLQKAAQ